MKKTLLLLMCLLMCIALCACRGTGKALTVNGREVDQAEYVFYLNFNRLRLFSKKTGYTNADLLAAREAAIAQITAAEVVREKCSELGLKPSDEQKAALSAEKTALITSLGGKKAYRAYLKNSCLTERTYDKLAANEVYYNLLLEYVTEQNKAVFTDEYLRAFYQNGYICVKYIRISLVDGDGQAVSAKEREKAAALADKVAEKAKNGVDFDTLILQYSDDAELKGGTEGIVISAADAEQQGYLQAAFALSDGQVSGVEEQSDGFYIVKRIRAEDRYYTENLQYIKAAAAEMYFSEMLDGWTGQAKVSTKKVIGKINFDNLKKYVK